MCNPLDNEKEIYEKISKEKLVVPSVIWQLLDHHLGNDIYVITLIAGTHVTGERQEPIPAGEGRKIIEHCEEMRRFLQRLRKVSAA
ncbi:MAG: hypothetical protein HZA35_03295 [Parcubacteria group bacterium]|nr:hypothetical protein [Parcubacteria group bacterium]